jgi:hypothetical protein
MKRRGEGETEGREDQEVGGEWVMKRLERF